MGGEYTLLPSNFARVLQNLCKILHLYCIILDELVIRFVQPFDAVEERSVSLRRRFERVSGGIGSENADISNVKTGEKPVRRKPKVSCAMLIIAGLVSP